MRRRMIIGLTVVILIGTLMLASVQPANALQAWVSKIKSDCSAIQAEMTLVWDRDDGNGNDKFRLELYDDASGALLTSIDEQITQKQSPWFWQTHRVSATASKWLYRIEMWDINEDGDKVRLVDSVRHDCDSHATWRVESDIGQQAVEPVPSWDTCRVQVSFNSTNVAPEPGSVSVMFSYGTDYTDHNYFVGSWHFSQGDWLDDDTHWLWVPCGVYLKVYFQPDSDKQIYYMPSQYWPGDGYGTSTVNGKRMVSYHTVFPLDGSLRPDIED